MFVKIFVFSFLSVFAISCSQNAPGNPIEEVSFLTNGDIQLIQTTESGDKLTSKGFINFTTNGGQPSGITINIDDSITCQKIIGFGGAFTESSTVVLSQLPAAKRLEVINAYFSTNGAAYSLCRLPVGSCDFSTNSFSYDETPGDTSLSQFSIDRDKLARIPLIKNAMAASGAQFKILASPWTPPSWMTTVNALVAAGKHLSTDKYAVYANYLVKYIQSMSNEGIAIDYLTVQNESLNNEGVWETCEFQPSETASFVKNNLYPAFIASNIQTKILIYDHNKGEDQLKTYADGVFSDPAAEAGVWGMAMHWYGGSGDSYSDISNTHAAYPAMHFIHTEACGEGGPHIGDYDLALRYGTDILGCLNNWAEGWIDWNMVLNMQGGPNHANNMCSSPVNADSGGTVIYNPIYYYMAHFSKYFRPDSYRIKAAVSSTLINVTAVKNPDGMIALAVMNTGPAQIYHIVWGNKTAKVSIKRRCIQTLLFK